MSHSILPPSGASSWLKCDLWATMNQRYPQEESPAAQEGTAAHWVANELFEGRVQTEGTQTPNGLIVTEEMVDAAALLVATVRERMGDKKIHIEEKLSMSDLHPECFGTPDYWATSGVSHHIEIVDYKFGHRFVDEFFNPQGLCYLAGILQVIHGADGKAWNDTTVAFTVVQPRCYYKGAPVRTHEFKLSEAISYAKLLKEAANRSTSPNPTATTNSECDVCPGRHSCDALQKAAYSDAEFATTRAPLDLSPEAAGLELRMLSRALERLEARVDGLREITLTNLKAGRTVPFYHLENGTGRRAWTVPTAQVIALGNLTGVKLGKEAVVTPSQAIKLGIDEAVIMSVSSTPATAAKLVADNPADVRKVFGK